MKKFVLVAETGSDISPEMAAEFDIEIVPMHVSFDSETLPDGTFPVEKILETTVLGDHAYFYTKKKEV